MPVGVGPLETIVNVGWPSGYYIAIKVQSSRYNLETNPHARRGSVLITPTGVAAGGQIIWQKNVDVAESPPLSFFYAILRFNRIPKFDGNKTAFIINLSGARSFPSGGVEVTEFCGTTTDTFTQSNYYAVPSANPDVPFIFQDLTFTTNSPAGTQILAYANGPLSLEDGLAAIGHGAFSTSTSTDSIWFQDQFGNYVNEHRPCSELGSGDPVISTYLEGFSSIEVVAFAKKSAVLMQPDAIVDDVPVRSLIDGVQLFYVDMPKYPNGFDADHRVINLDLPNGDYEFKMLTTQFDEFALLTSGKKQNVLTTFPYKAPEANVKYSFEAASFRNTTTFQDYINRPTNPFGMLIPASVRPLPNQHFF